MPRSMRKRSTRPRLLQKGVCPGRIVGLWMPRGHELLIAQIAIAKTGAAWLPFDADAPAERIAICLSMPKPGAYGPPLLSPTSSRRLPGLDLCGLLADAKETLDAARIDARALGARPDDPAYLIYTSGSTGTPKGIAISGRNICHYLRAANEIYGVLESDVVFQGASVAFDLSMEEIWLPYLVGASLFVATAEMMGEADKLPGLLEEHRVSVLDTVPTLLSLLLRDVASLRLIILGGEACPPSIASRWCRPGRKIFNSMALPRRRSSPPSRKCGQASRSRSGGQFQITRAMWRARASIFFRPAWKVSFSSADLGSQKAICTATGLPARNLSPILLSPTLFKRGAGPCFVQVWRRRPDRRERRNRLPRRIDDQVKVRGFRVELGEIETKLTEVSGVAQAAVVLRTDNDIEQLVAFVVASFESEIDIRFCATNCGKGCPPIWCRPGSSTSKSCPNSPPARSTART